MPSSLDELQPNDYLQEELEEELQNYLKEESPGNSEKLFILNQFIEFVCFHKNFEKVNQVLIPEVEIEFYNHFSDLFPLFKQEEIKTTLKGFLLFLDQKFNI